MLTQPFQFETQLSRPPEVLAIASMTNSSAFPKPTYTFTFSSPLSGMPELGYGVKDYEGNDYLKPERFEVERIGLTPSTFTVEVEIVGNTNIWLLSVPYIAIDSTFPHHLNSFDNVPLNYSAGTLTNISTFNALPQTYTNIIDYQMQALGREYNTFS